MLERLAEHRQAAHPHHSVQYNEFEELVALLLDEHQQPSTHAPTVDASVLHQVGAHAHEAPTL